MSKLGVRAHAQASTGVENGWDIAAHRRIHRHFLCCCGRHNNWVTFD